ncbi:Calcium/calmodulin-dependent protein kinase protein [Dioscorea alata]|uniref:Calcium/calmodulin-dependent protein kinase protein n=1 Tax=Dioscorea alata TaxID=55571 RepID=A0ACB7VXH7_DIOAL|nr:Calcium/calmodulin-dependent protein kinase protein [Dioscorea alata]
MVQRKAPDKPQLHPHLISHVVKSHCHAPPPSSYQQEAAQIKGGGGGDIKKTMMEKLITSTLPNYMKQTCSSGAKNFCSLKPSHSACNVCSYTYCCLNGHGRHDELRQLPLKQFLSERRRLMNNKQDIELSSDFFIEIHDKSPQVKDIDVQSSEEVNVMMDFPAYDSGSVSETPEQTEIESEQLNDMEADIEKQDEDEVMDVEPVHCNQNLTECDNKRKSRNEPQYLQVESEPEAEKVDLRHLVMSERRTAEEWMIDYALQEVVNKLGPARKSKVELLVEAFEIVRPTPECELPPKHAQQRPVQARS